MAAGYVVQPTNEQIQFIIQISYHTILHMVCSDMF